MIGDKEIIDHMWQGYEDSITSVKEKYHRLCIKLSYNITGNMPDAEECVNDSYMKLWNAIPPNRPNSLKAFLLRIVKNTAIDRVRKDKKRLDGAGLKSIYAELSLPESMDMDRYYDFEIQQLDGQDWYSLGGSLSGSISSRLVDLDKQKRTMTYMMEFSASSGDIREQKMRFSFKDLYSYRIVDDEIIDKRLEAKLDFVFYSMLSYTPNLVNYEPGKKISGKHNTVWIDRITITPISLTIGARAEGGYSFWDEERTEREGSFVTAIILNDGSRVETRDSSTSVNIFDQVSYKTIYDGIVNPKDIQQIEFFGQDTLYLGGLDYTNDTKASLDARRLADLTFNMGIFISIISMLISIISMLYLCKSDIYLSFERVQARKKKKGREYSFDQYLALTNKVLLKTAVAYRFFLVLLLLVIGWLTYMIISNWFVTMTVFVDILLIGLTLLLFITIKEIGRFRRRLTKL